MILNISTQTRIIIIYWKLNLIWGGKNVLTLCFVDVCSWSLGTIEGEEFLSSKVHLSMILSFWPVFIQLLELAHVSSCDLIVNFQSCECSKSLLILNWTFDLCLFSPFIDFMFIENFFLFFSMFTDHCSAGPTLTMSSEALHAFFFF